VNGHRIWISLLAVAACNTTKPTPHVESVQSLLSSSDYVIVHQLTNGEGAAPRGRLVELGGRLYGLAGEAGPNGPDNCQSTASWDTVVHTQQCPGSLFSMALDGSDFRVDHGFTWLDANGRNADGYHPYGSPAVGPDGRIWGVTQAGGTSPGCASTAAGAGVLWAFDPSSGAFTVEHEFCSLAGAADGKNPMGTVAFFGGAVYGTAKGSANAGNAVVVWRWRPGGAFAFTPPATSYGWSAYGGLAATSTALVGMTNAGADNGRGALFSVDPETLAVTKVWAFPAFTSNAFGQDNPAIQVPLVLSNGAIVAAREFGGAAGTGIVVDLSTPRVLKELNDIPFTAVPRFSNATGGMANGSLVEGRDGLLYGATMYGGASGVGVIYRIARDGSLFQVLHSFAAGGPARSYGGLTLASDGHFYGIAFAGKAIFRFDPPTALALGGCP
jgi:uncharacterized repeat protein (TIGR03803 family)